MKPLSLIQEGATDKSDQLMPIANKFIPGNYPDDWGRQLIRLSRKPWWVNICTSKQWEILRWYFNISLVFIMIQHQSGTRNSCWAICYYCWFSHSLPLKTKRMSTSPGFLLSGVATVAAGATLVVVLKRSSSNCILANYTSHDDVTYIVIHRYSNTCVFITVYYLPIICR